MPAQEAQQYLTRLFEAARSPAGEDAVCALLQERQVEQLRRIARALDRHLGEGARRWKSVERIRAGIAKEILRRAFRNDVFLDPAVRSFRAGMTQALRGEGRPARDLGDDDEDPAC